MRQNRFLFIAFLLGAVPLLSPTAQAQSCEPLNGPPIFQSETLIYNGSFEDFTDPCNSIFFKKFCPGNTPNPNYDANFPAYATESDGSPEQYDGNKKCRNKAFPTFNTKMEDKSFKDNGTPSKNYNPNAKVFEGLCAMTLTCNAANPVTNSYITQTLEIADLENYQPVKFNQPNNPINLTLSLWALQPFGTQGLRLFIDALNSNGQTIKDSSGNPIQTSVTFDGNGQGWKYFQTMYQPPTGTKKLRVFIDNLSQPCKPLSIDSIRMTANITP